MAMFARPTQYMVSKVVINLLMQLANWAVRNSRVSYAYILVDKLSVLPIQTQGRI